MDTTRIRHTGTIGTGRANALPQPGLRSIQEILAPVMARLAAQQFADRSALDDVIGWHRSEHHRAEREAGGEDQAPEDPALAEGEHRSAPHF